jgi:hypothetical protein
MGGMDETEYRAWRVRLRQITGALLAEATASGATCQTAGVMEIVLDRRHPEAGYVTPRHGTVWVPDSQVRAALDELQAAGGPYRLRLVDGLYPPAFVAALRAAGLRLVDERPLELLPLEAGDGAARLVESAQDRQRWQALTGIAQLPSPGASDWLLGADEAAAVRLGAPSHHAARLLGWGSAEAPARGAQRLAGLRHADPPGIDLLFRERDLAQAQHADGMPGFRDCGALLTFEGSG